MSWPSETSQNKGPFGDTPTPRRYRCKLRTSAEVSGEIARLYREARTGLLSVDHASKLANVLYIVGRLIQGGELDALTARLDAIEATQGAKTGIGRR